MAADDIEKADAKKMSPPAPVSHVRIGVGLSAGFLLHQTILAVGTALAPFVLNAMGEKEYAQLCPNSPTSIAWLLAWASGAGLVCWWKKPSVKEWTLPFVPLGCLWLLSSCGRADTQEEAIGQEIGKGMLLACTLITMLGITNLILGEKWWHRSSLERLVASIVPGFAYRHAPSDVLERISPPAETTPEVRWQPPSAATEADTQSLLHNGLPRDSGDRPEMS